MSLRDALDAQDRLRADVSQRMSGEPQRKPLWSEFAVALFEAKVAEGTLKSPKSQERWRNVLERLLPVFGDFHVDELRAADLLAWRDQVALWIRDGMPSTRARDAGKRVLVNLAPITANV